MKTGLRNSQGGLLIRGNMRGEMKRSAGRERRGEGGKKEKKTPQNDRVRDKDCGNEEIGHKTAQRAGREMISEQNDTLRGKEIA